MPQRLGHLTKFILVVIALSACSGSKGSSSSSSTNGPIATNLQTTIDGWSFPNYPSSTFPDTDFNEEDLVSMFGSGEDICVGGVATPCTLTAEASAWARMVNQSRASGHCEGLVAIASTRFNNKESPSTVKLPSQSETLHAIMRAFATQFLPEVQDSITLWLSKSLEEKIDELKNSFTTGKLNYTLGLYTDGGGHALLPYAIEYPTPSTPRILLYDSNWPGKNRYVDVDLKAQTWRFSFSSEDPENDPSAWTGGPDDMDLTPLSAREGSCPFCGDGTKVAKTTMLIRSSNLDWSVETDGGVVSPGNPVGSDGTAILPVKGAVQRDSYDYLVSVPASSNNQSATTVANKNGTKARSKLKFSGSTSVYAMMPDGIAQFTTPGTSDNPVEIEGSSISTKDPGVDLTLASGNLVANASGAAISLSISGGTMEVAVTTASGQVVQQQVSEDKPTLQMKADPAGGGITVLAASSTGVVEKTEVSSTGVETKSIVKEVLNLSEVKAELPPELASKEIAALPSLANRNMANPNYKVDPVYTAPSTTVPKESSGDVTKKDAPQAPTVGKLVLPSVEFGDVPFTVQTPTSNSKGEWKFSSSKPDVAQINATNGRVTVVGAGTATITASQAAVKDYEAISVTADLLVVRATPVLGVFTTTARTVGDDAFALASPTSTSSAVFKMESSDESVAKFSKVNGKLSIVGAGKTTITASQPANDDFLATSKNFVLTVRKGTPVLSVTADLSSTFGENGPTIAKPTSESRGAVSFTSSNPAVATVNATTGQVTVVSAGTTTITATQAATDDYVSATQTFTFTVKQAVPRLGALTVGSKTFGDAEFSIAKPTSTSSGTFTFTSNNSNVLKVNEAGKATVEGAGSATITATQGSTTNYEAASSSVTVQVGFATPALITPDPITKKVGDPTFLFNWGTSPSDGAITFTSSNPSAATIDATTGRVTTVGIGVTTLTMSQSKGTNHTAVSIESVLTVEAAPVVITQLSLSNVSSCGLTSTGAMKCWGSNVYGQIGTLASTEQKTPIDVPGFTTDISAIAVGDSRTCALTTAGEVKCIGNGVADSNIPGISSGAISISSGYANSCALMSYGGVKCWGDNWTGQLGDGTGVNQSPAVHVKGLTSGVTAITSGISFSCALLTNGSVKCWGANDYGQLGDGTNSTKFEPTQVTVNGLPISGVASISGGNEHACAVLTNGEAMCWGRNDYGQLGDGTSINKNEPTPVVSLGATIRSISSGLKHTCAITTGGAAKCWGHNAMGSLGNGEFTDSLIPVDVDGLDSGVLSIEASKSFTTCATVTGASVKCWGQSWAGNVGDGFSIDRSSPVDVVELMSGSPSATTLGALTLPSSQFTTTSADFTLAAPTSSRVGTFSFASSNPDVATVDAATGVVQIKGTGTAVLAATIGGDGQYRATSALVTITVGT